MYQIVKNDDSGVRLDRWLKENLQDITYVEIQKLIRTGQVRVDGGRKKQNYRVNSGEKVRFPPKFTKVNIDINKNMLKNMEIKPLFFMRQVLFTKSMDGKKTNIK